MCLIIKLNDFSVPLQDVQPLPTVQFETSSSPQYDPSQPFIVNFAPHPHPQEKNRKKEVDCLLCIINSSGCAHAKRSSVMPPLILSGRAVMLTPRSYPLLQGHMQCPRPGF